MGRKKKVYTVAAIGLAIVLIFLESALAYDKIFIVGNKTAVGLAKQFFTTLNNESIPLEIVTSQFDKVKSEKYIFVLGGAKGPGSVEDFVNQVLTKEEQASANESGGRMFVKENVFAPGQTIIVFTGPDEAAAADARKNNRELWWEYLVEWFELDTSSPMAY